MFLDVDVKENVLFEAVAFQTPQICPFPFIKSHYIRNNGILCTLINDIWSFIDWIIVKVLLEIKRKPFEEVETM